MESTDKDQGLSLKDLIRVTGAPPHVIRYLIGLGRIPFLRESPGPGYPHRFHIDSVLIVQKHLEKSGKYSLTHSESSKPAE